MNLSVPSRDPDHVYEDIGGFFHKFWFEEMIELDHHDIFKIRYNNISARLECRYANDAWCDYMPRYKLTEAYLSWVVEKELLQ